MERLKSISDFLCHDHYFFVLVLHVWNKAMLDRPLLIPKCHLCMCVPHRVTYHVAYMFPKTHNITNQYYHIRPGSTGYEPLFESLVLVLSSSIPDDMSDLFTGEAGVSLRILTGQSNYNKWLRDFKMVANAKGVWKLYSREEEVLTAPDRNAYLTF
jgi:hypothetical protein